MAAVVSRCQFTHHLGGLGHLYPVSLPVLAMVMGGLILFLLGVHVGLLPIGERIGSALPQTGKLWVILVASVVLGFVVTIAEHPM